MKIECPKCGQHYEVDSSMIARHFCCTECKTLFLGLNAKPVKNTKFVPKGEGSEDGEKAASENSEKSPEAATLNAVSNSAAAEAAAGEAAAAVAVDSAKTEGSETAPAEKSVEADNGENSEKPVVKITRLDPLLDIPILGSAVMLNRLLAMGTGILVVVALIWLGVQNSKISKLQKSNANLLKGQEELRGQVDALTVLSGKVDRNAEAVDDLRSKYTKLIEDTTVAKKLDELTDKIKELEEKNARQKEEIEKLTAGIDELNEKIDEKNSKSSTKRKQSR